MGSVMAVGLVNPSVRREVGGVFSFKRAADGVIQAVI